MTAIPYTISRDALTLFIDGVPYTANKDHPRYQEITELLLSRNDFTSEQMLELVSIKKQIEQVLVRFQVDDVTVGQDAVYYKGSPVHSHLASRMLEILNLGHDITPWALFMNKLYQNPSKTAVDELFLWLEQSNMPITPNGNFLAYKKVRDDYSSFHKGPNNTVVMNLIGTEVSMSRNEVDDQRDRTCSQGLHFCSYQYLPHYYGTQGRVVMLEIDPADVVSIPSDYDNAKGRAWRYKVVGEIAQKDAEFAFVGRPVVDDYYYPDYDT